MNLGYINFSAEEQQLVHDVIQRMNQGAIDELGLGRIRDAFSDEMFPGMSTLHKRAKYFVLLPALYDRISRKRITDRNEIPSLIRAGEINLTLSLLSGVEGNPDKLGITGSSIGVEKLEAGKFVKITPTNIYLGALRYYGLVKDNDNLVTCIFRQSKINAENSQKRRLTSDEILEDPDSNETNSGVAYCFESFPGYSFDFVSKIDLQLSESEAKILRDHIIQKCFHNGKDNLFSYILKHDDIKIVGDFFDMQDSIHKFPDDVKELRDVYDMAVDFAKWAMLMNSYYRYDYNIHLNPSNPHTIEKIRAGIEFILNNGDYPDKDRLNQILGHISTKIGGLDKSIDFCMKASELLGVAEKEKELLQQIEEREMFIKKHHSKIGNEKYSDIDYSGMAGNYHYRWNEIVYSLIRDIRNPLKI